MGEVTSFGFCFIVVRVKFEEPSYTSSEDSGQVTICLVKDLETASGFTVESVTSDNTAKGE